MKRLAVELSSAQGSLALYEDVRCLEEVTWTDERFNSQRFFEELDALFKRYDTDIEQLTRIIAGRGPGNFTGLRISMAAIQGLAMPHNIDLLAVSSGYALAWEIMQEENAGRVTVSGDARRSTVWTGTFTNQNGRLRVEKDWHLVPTNQFEHGLPEEAVHVSPEWSRISHHLSRQRHWITQDRYPRASFLNELIHQRTQMSIEEPFEPIYMHPPVDQKPTTA